MSRTPAEHRSDRGVIWDMDGVIVDSAPAHLRAWRQLARETGVTFTDEYFWQTFGMPNLAIIRPIWGTDLDDARVKELADRKEQLFRDFVRTDITALPGALALLHGLRAAGYRQALASSAPMENIALISEALGIRPLLDALISGETVPQGKPAPDVFLAAAQRLGVAPARAVVIEDASAGVQAARAAGMRCIAVARDSSQKQTLSERPGTEGNKEQSSGLALADLVVTSLEQVDPATVDRLLQR